MRVLLFVTKSAFWLEPVHMSYRDLVIHTLRTGHCPVHNGSTYFPDTPLKSSHVQIFPPMRCTTLRYLIVGQGLISGRIGTVFQNDKGRGGGGVMDAFIKSEDFFEALKNGENAIFVPVCM